MKGVYSVFTEYRSEKVIERSRFISTCSHVESEEEARAFLARVRTEFPDATHHCYAFVADTLGTLMRFSDDGEPQGTAGMRPTPKSLDHTLTTFIAHINTV